MRFLHCIHGQSHCYHVEYGGNNYDTVGENYLAQYDSKSMVTEQWPAEFVEAIPNQCSINSLENISSCTYKYGSHVHKRKKITLIFCFNTLLR